MDPGTCSTGIHILLEECSLVFEIYVVNLLAGDHHAPAYFAINPKATIPTLVREDGIVLTDFQAITWWLAYHYPKAMLLPLLFEEQSRCRVMRTARNWKNHSCRRR
jgi:glutathione S-transferase